MIKVRITKQAKAKTGYQVDGALVNDIAPMGGADYNRNIGTPKLMESRYITADPRDESNVEAEGGEIVYGDINGDLFPEAQIIKGPRHAQGGVPLNLPEDTFIFSDTRSMRIKDCEILTMFGKPCGKQSYTPAELAKQYDIQKYRVLLEDPDSNAIEKKTAELMIKNYVVKLGCLALKQEAMKGFPQGIPAVARPCMEAKGITEEQILPSKELTVLKDQLEKQKQQSSGGDENMLNEAMGINEGRPVAQPQPIQQAPQPMQQAPPQMGMAYGGGYSEQYKQQMQQQQAAQQQMMQLAQQVQSALEQGASPQKVVEALLYDQVDPNTIVGIFTQLGASEQEAAGLVQQTMAAAQQQAPQEAPQQPMAKYGMPIMDWGGEITVNEADYSTPEEFQKALRNAYANVGEKGTVYVLKKNGQKVRQKVSATGHSEYKGSDLASGWNNNQVAAATYQAINQTFQDKLAREALAKQMRTALTNKENYKSKKGSYSDMYQARFGKDPNSLSDDELVNSYLRMQERNLKTTTMGGKAFAGLPSRSDGKPYPFGSWMYKDGDGNLRKKTGTGTGDDLGFVEAVMKADPGITRAEAEKMYDALNVNEYKSLKAISNSIGLPMNWGADNAMNEEAYLQQAGFIAANNLMKDLQAHPEKYTPEQRASLLGVTSFAGFNPYGKQVGFSDESGMGEINISPIDAYYTNTTQGEIQAHHGIKFEDFIQENCQCDDENAPNYSPYKDAEGKCTCDPPIQNKKCPCRYPDGREVMMTPDPTTGECPPCEQDVDVEVPGGYAPWWLQDTIKTTGAFGDLMGIKKYMPWAPGVDLEEPRPTFLDPTRELAANAEQANIQTQGMAQFAGPQALSARSSGIQGQAAKNAADVLAKYNNANVNIANQFEMKATDIRNQESMLRQASQQKLYDQNTVANQQFDNAKLAMRNQLRNYYTNAITNRWKTDAMNQMYPDYAVDPSVGGQMYHTPNPKTPSPTTSGAMTQQQALDWCKQNDPNTSTSQCVQRMMSTNKFATSGNTQAAPPNMYPFKHGGEVNTGYMYFNPWFNDDI